MTRSAPVRVIDRSPHYSQVPWQLQTEPGARPIHLTLYAALHRTANWNTGTAGPTNATLMEYARIGDWRTFSKAREWLQDRGYITVHHNPGAATSYELHALPARRVTDMLAATYGSEAAEAARSVARKHNARNVDAYAAAVLAQQPNLFADTAPASPLPDCETCHNLRLIAWTSDGTRTTVDDPQADLVGPCPDCHPAAART